MPCSLRLMLGLAIVFMAADRALACDCAHVEPKPMLERADVVFVGEVISREPTEAHGQVYTFKAQRKYKGVKDVQMKIHTGMGGGDCGFAVKPGTRMFVYASRAENGTLSTNICMRTRTLDQATEDLAAHGEGEAVE